MRISDWSSDVCSSDLTDLGRSARPVGGSAAARLVLGRIVARHARHAIAREYGDGGGAGGRLGAEPLLVQRGDGAVELHALDRVLDPLPPRLVAMGRASRRGSVWLCV